MAESGTSIWTQNTAKPETPVKWKPSVYLRYRQKETAHHEAAHAVAAHQLGLPLETVSIVSRGTSLGHTTLAKRANSINPKNMTPAGIEGWVRKHGIICFAGMTGSLFYSGDENRSGASEDIDVLRTILHFVASSEDDANNRANALWKETKSIIWRDWSLVCAVAAALVKSKVLNSAQVSEASVGVKERRD